MIRSTATPVLVSVFAILAGATCRANEPVAATPEPSPAPAAFTCATAPAVLGHPGHTVATCAEVPHLPGFFRVTLSHPDEGTLGLLVPTYGSGRVDSRKGLDAASEWLHASRALDDPALGMRQVMMVLEAFAAFPPPITVDAQSFDQPGVGTSSFTVDPFRLELFAEVGAVDGAYAEPTYTRAVLVDADGRLAWQIARGSQGAWEPVTP